MKESEKTWMWVKWWERKEEVGCKKMRRKTIGRWWKSGWESGKGTGTKNRKGKIEIE